MKNILIVLLLFCFSNKILCQNAYNLEDDIYDPFETSNRFFFEINSGLDCFVFEPMAEIYDTITPTCVQTAVKNIVRNFSGPGGVVNSLICLEIDDALLQLASFVTNSTFGICGAIDIFDLANNKIQYKSFADTFKQFDNSVPAYFIVPALGPTTAHNMFANCVDFFLNPLSIFTYNKKPSAFYSVKIAETLELKRMYLKNITNLSKLSVDEYAAVRSIIYAVSSKQKNSSPKPSSAR